MRLPNTMASAIIVLSFFSCHSPRQGNFDSYETLSAGFRDPKGTSRPKVYWWWLNGNMDTVRMKEDLVAIKEAGLGGVDIFEIGFRPEGVMKAGPPFLGEESLRSIAVAIREAKRLELEVGLNLASSWNAGGSWITPEHSAKSLYYSKTTVSGGRKKIHIPFPDIDKSDPEGNPRLIEFAPDGKPVYRREVAVLAIPHDGKKYLDTARIVNVSRFLDSEKDEMNWEVPEGEWEVLRFVCSSSGEALKLPSPRSVGSIIDHFDSAATAFHFTYFIEKLQAVLGDFRKTALKNFYLASFEASGTVWSPTLPATFRKINGYDVYMFLPQLFDSAAFAPEVADAFRRDLDLTLSEMIIHNHYGKGKKIANEHGLQLISESGGPGPPLHNVVVDGIKALGTLDVPRGEFWINHSRFDGTPDSIDLLMLVKEVSAAAHTYQRKIAEMEAFTSFQNWQEGPGDMRPIGDRAFMEGMNRVVIHGFTHNPRGSGFPGIAYAAGTHYNTKTTWWRKSRPFNDYLARVSYVLQETDFVADVLYYYGDRVPNFVTPKNTRFAVGSGYDYEVINTEVLLRDLSVKDGLLTLPYGAQFRILALGDIYGKDPAVLEKLAELASQGAVITMNKTEKIPPPGRALADQLWKSGKIFSSSPLEILQSQRIGPDFDYPDKGSQRLDYQHKEKPLLDYIHSRKGDLDFYFVRNTSNARISRLCSFRQQHKSPELWDPVSSEIIPVNIYQENGGRTEVPLTFEPYASWFVVFIEKRAEPEYLAVRSAPYPPFLKFTRRGTEFLERGDHTLTDGRGEHEARQNIVSYAIGGPWAVSFDQQWGGPGSVEVSELTSWTSSPDEGIKYYSGTAVYIKTFTHAPAEHGRVYLDLGKVSKVAEVWLNDQPLGITWTMPYRYDVTGMIKPGENHLRIEVVNTWSNRIIGDIRTKKKYTRTNLSQRGSRELLWTETPLQESGLLGPVTVEVLF